jgi:predicted DNA repair protein MutK
MPGGSLLLLLDDITSVLDDVATMTKVATQKTAGVLGDDLALNAQQVTGVNADRELPVVWGVAKGSLVNKAILVPSALAISAVAPFLIKPLLMIGGAFLCFEGVEKLAHKFLHSDDHADEHAAPAEPLSEKDKIKGAVRTDFILSAEIIVISLGTVGEAPFMTRVAVLCAIGVIMTIGVYGLVAGIVKLDDFGLYLTRTGEGFRQTLGKGILAAAPLLMRFLSVAGTAAMFLVGGGILTHNLPPVHHLFEAAEHAVHGLPGVGGVLAKVTPMLLDGVFGVLAGIVVLIAVTVLGKMFKKKSAA